MDKLNEKLLDAWVRVSLAVNSERVVSEMPYNESVVCNILYRNERETKESRITATDLCNRTKILKSQMNRILNSLEGKGFITRERSAKDKRQVFVKFNMDKADLYVKQHAKILKLVDAFIEKFGKEKAVEIIDIFNGISDLAEEVIYG